MSDWPCDIAACRRNAAGHGGTCWYCGGHYCTDHAFEAEFHACKGKGLGIDTERPQSRLVEHRIQKLAERIDIASLVRSAESFRPGRRCRGPAEITAKTLLECSGCTNVHIVLTWDDGQRWVARIRQLCQVAPSREVEALTVIAEAATFRALHDGGALVPQAWIDCELVRSSDVKYFFVDFIEGKKYYPLLGPQLGVGLTNLTVKAINGIAKFNIALEKVSFSAVGSPTIDSSGQIAVGPIVDRCRLKGSSPWFLGPYKSARARYSDYFGHILRQIINNDWCAKGDRLYQYLAYLEMKTLVEGREELNQGPYYILHGSPKGDHILFNEDMKLEAVIDWEKSTLTCKAEAFAAPYSFVHPAFNDGSNQLWPYELALMEAYIRLGRDDLAELVRRGKKWQRLTLSKRWLPSFRELNAARRAFLELPDGIEAEPRSKEAWMKATQDRYRNDEGLLRLLAETQ